MARWENQRNTGGEIRRLKREAVLREAALAFGRHGYHNTTLDDIAETLGISKGTLYNYVRDKQEILYECHREALEIGEQAEAHGAKHGGSGASRLRASMEYYIENLVRQLGACAALMEVDALRPPEKEIIVKGRRAFEQKFKDVVLTGREDGTLRPDVDPDLVLVTFMGAVNWIPRWYSPEGRLGAADVAAKMVDLLMSGVEETRSGETSAQG
ncbi:TetR/AcrR family transcriptional regulator [Streptomyces sp. NPDC002623]